MTCFADRAILVNGGKRLIEDAATAARFLLSGEAVYVTGPEYRVIGGLSLA